MYLAVFCMPHCLMTEWTQIQDSEVIDLLQKRECLYNTEAKSYFDRNFAQIQNTNDKSPVVCVADDRADEGRRKFAEASRRDKCRLMCRRIR